MFSEKQGLTGTIYSLLFIAFCSISSSVTAAPALTTGPNFTPAPAAPLAGLLELSTDLPSRISVRVSEGGSDVWERLFDPYQTSHSMPLTGFKPGRNYQIHITLHDLQGGTNALPTPVLFNTDPLPAGFPPIQTLVSQPEKMEPGYTLFPIARRSVIVDMAGDIVWYATIGVADIRQLANGNLFFVNGRNDLIQEINMLGEVQRNWHASLSGSTPPAGSIPVSAMSFHHEAYPTSHGTILTLGRETVSVDDYPTSETDCSAPTTTADVLEEPVVEFDPLTGTVLNEWPLMSFLDPTRIGYGSVFNTGGLNNNDWAHANAVIHDPKDDSIIVSVRHQDSVIKFSRQTGQLIWILGPHENWNSAFQPFLLAPVGSPFEWQYHQHAPQVTPQGTLLLFDNGNNRASPCDSGLADADNYSRAVEYAIDETNMEVSQVWQYGGSGNVVERIYSRFISDADWLDEKGNVLITFGGASYIDGTATVGDSVRIIEVDHNVPSEKVFELSIPAQVTGDRFTSYRSERIPDLYPSPMSVNVNADPQTPRVFPVGPVTFSALATGGSGNYEYEFWIRSPAGVWTQGQIYSGDNTFQFTPTSIGSWTIQARVRNVGSSAVLNALGGLLFNVVGSSPVTSVNLDASPEHPALLPANVTFTAAASGGSGSYEYEFWVRNPAGRWTREQTYSGNPEFLWTPTGGGTWAIQARARNVGSAVSFEVTGGMLYEVIGPADSVGVSSDTPSPAQFPVGTVTFTATALGGSGNYQYEFWVRDPTGTWVREQVYSAADEFLWVAPGVGNWTIQARARNFGSVDAIEAVGGLHFSVTDNPPVASASLSADPSSPVAQSTPITLTAGASGGLGIYEYEFWTRSPGGVWSRERSYDTSSNHLWTPITTGSWTVQVRVRNQSSTAVFEALGGIPKFQVTP
jgi:hypothetical protein